MDLYLQESILVLFIQLGLNKKVLDAALDWDSKEGNIPKDSYTFKSDILRHVPTSTDRTATDRSNGVSMPFSRHKVDSRGNSY